MADTAVKDKPQTLKKSDLADMIAEGVKAGVKELGLTQPQRRQPAPPAHPDNDITLDGPEAAEFREVAQRFWNPNGIQGNADYVKNVDGALGFKRDANGRLVDSYTEEPIGRGIRAARFMRAMAAQKRGQLPASLARALAEGTNSAGGYVVPPQYVAELIPLLRAFAVVRAAGTRQIPLRQNMTQPRLTTASTAAYVGENAVIPKSQQVFGQFTLSVKKLAALVPISNDLIRDSDPAIDAIVRDDIVASMALKQDLQFIRGTGSATAPTGIRNQSGIQTLALGTNGGTPSYDNLSDLLGLVETSNVPFLSPGWIAHGRFLGTLRKIKDSQGRPILEAFQAVPGQPFNPFYTGATGNDGSDVRRPPRWTLLGYPLWISNQIPTNLTKGTSTDASEIYFGDFYEAVIGQNMEMVIDVSTEASYTDTGTNDVSAFASDQTIVRAIERHDFGLKEPAGFAVITDARP